MSRKRLLVLYAGGTIGMTRTATGLAPDADFLPRELQRIAARMPTFPDYTLKQYAPLIDSSNLVPAHWNLLADDIAAHYDDYDGFVVIHGTDTLAYTASALSFMLRHLAKPVVVTGAMVPLCDQPNDGEQNLVDAFYWATRDDLYEVVVAFNRLLLRGNRCRKLWGNEIGAFGSPNYPVLGRYKGEYVFHHALSLPRPTQPFAHQRIDPALPIVGLKLYPGHTPRVIEAVLADTMSPLAGVVIETYGNGNLPDMDATLLTTLAAAHARGVVLVNVTQCMAGAAATEVYATGAAAERAGLVSGRDLTPEAAIAKLYWLLSTPHEGPLPLAERVALNVCGELTRE
jgi:L-asparaginase